MAASNPGQKPQNYNVKLSLSALVKFVRGVKMQVRSLLTSTPDDGEWSTRRRDLFTPEKKPGSNFIGNLVCPKAGLDISEKRKSNLPGHEPLTIQSVAWSLH